VANPANGEDVDSVISTAIRNNDLSTAFRVFVTHHGPRVYSLCCRMLKDRTRAEDVMQETHMKAFERIAELRDPERMRAWVMRIATSSCLDTLRQLRRRGTVEDAFADVDTVALTTDLLADLASSEAKRALEDCLSRMTPAKRAAVLGRFFADLPYDQLSEAIGEAPDTLRIRVMRALPELRACLESKGVTS
jgi:RNA polymerase sigma-70 factor (ECF subfamily)